MSIDVLSFGETMLRLSPPEGIRLDSATTFSVHVAGTESNTLCTLARLGLQTAWLSALPDTPLGRRVESELRQHGVQTTHILWQQDPTRLGIFYAEEAPPPLGIQVYYDRANSACATLDPDTLDYTLVDQARLLHLTGITPALSEQARAATTRLFQRALAQHIPISFDVNYRAKLWSPTEAAHRLEEYCRQANILICTREDAADLWHITGSPQEILTRLSNRFAGNQQERTFVVTLGREGAAELRNGQFAIAPALPTEAVFASVRATPSPLATSIAIWMAHCTMNCVQAVASHHCSSAMRWPRSNAVSRVISPASTLKMCALYCIINHPYAFAKPGKEHDSPT